MVRMCQVCRKVDYKEKTLSFHRFPNNAEIREAWFNTLGLEETRILPKRADICSEHFSDDDFELKPSGLRVLKKGAVPKYRLTMITKKRSSRNIKKNLNSLYSETEPGPSKQRQHAASTEFSVEISSPVSSSSSDDSTTEEARSIRIFEPSVTDTEERDPLASSSSSTTTLTASEAEEQLLLLVKDTEANGSEVQPISQQKMTLIKSATKRNRRKRYVGDIKSDDLVTLRNARKYFYIAKKQIATQAKKIKGLQQSVRRLRRRIATMKSLMSLLKQQCMLSENSEAAVMALMEGINGTYADRHDNIEI